MLPRQPRLLQSLKMHQRLVRTGLEPLEPRALLSAGQPDVGFGSAGLVNGSFDIQRLVIQRDGKILTFNSPTANTATLQRFNSNGTADTAFDAAVDGDITFSVRAIALQADGKILLA